MILTIVATVSERYAPPSHVNTRHVGMTRGSMSQTNTVDTSDIGSYLLTCTALINIYFLFTCVW